MNIITEYDSNGMITRIVMPTNIYIGTYHEDGKEPVDYSVSHEQFEKERDAGDTNEEVKERLLSLARQARKHGFWTVKHEPV